MRRLLPLLVLGGCTATPTYFLSEPIPLRLDGGALVSRASVNAAQFDVVIDTGSPVTVWDDHLGHTALETGQFRLLDAAGIPRLELDEVRLYATPLRSLGLAGFPVGGVLGGDNLQHWVLGLDYRGAGPTLTLLDDLTPCSCELARDCEAAFPFTLAGGGQDRPLTIGGDVISYPATRILVDVCLEPLADPVSRDQACADTTVGNITNPAYLASGVDARLIVATGFPGFALSATAYDRLRGDHSSAALPSTRLHLPDEADDGNDSSGLPVGLARLGRSDAASLVIIDRQSRLSPCAELARSRRQRRNPLDHPRPTENGCQLTQLCPGVGNPPESCDDTKSKDHVSAVIELEDTLPTYVVADTAPILVGINADVRPQSATVDGIIGTEVLQRLVGAIDYPGRRLALRCAAGSNCLTYPAYRNPDAFNHPGGQGSGCGHDDLCVPPSEIPLNGGLCPAAP